MNDEVLEMSRDGGAHAIVLAMRQLEANVIAGLQLPASSVYGDSRYGAMPSQRPVEAGDVLTLGEPVEVGDQVALGADGRLYHADRLYHRLPVHMRPLAAEVRQWEKDVRADPSGAPIYADWCEEKGWDQRATELRRLPAPG